MPAGTASSATGELSCRRMQCRYLGSAVPHSDRIHALTGMRSLGSVP